MRSHNEYLDKIYNRMDGSEIVEAYFHRHGINSAGILTVINDAVANAIAEFLEEKIAGRTVIEIGAGIGLLGLHLGKASCRRVWD